MRRLYPLIILVILTACAVKQSVVTNEPLSRYGNSPFYQVNDQEYQVLLDASDYKEIGTASWYGEDFHDQPTSNGEIYDMYEMTAAHKELPLPSYVRVTNLENGREITVKVNDRGPFHDDRIIDLSYRAAKELDLVSNGTGLVEIKTIHPVEMVKKGGSPRVAEQQQHVYLQVGVFAEQRNAERLQQELEYLLAQPVHLIAVDDNSQARLYRVQVGPLLDREVFSAVHHQLADAGLENVLAVVE